METGDRWLPETALRAFGQIKLAASHFRYIPQNEGYSYSCIKFLIRCSLLSSL